MFISEIDNQQSKLDEEFNTTTEDVKAQENKKNELQSEKFDMEGDLDKNRSMLNQKEREYNMLIKDYEFAKDKEAVLMGDR